jgi:hypothetical protein
VRLEINDGGTAIRGGSLTAPTFVFEGAADDRADDPLALTRNASAPHDRRLAGAPPNPRRSRIYAGDYAPPDEIPGEMTTDAPTLVQALRRLQEGPPAEVALAEHCHGLRFLQSVPRAREALRCHGVWLTVGTASFIRSCHVGL